MLTDAATVLGSLGGRASHRQLTQVLSRGRLRAAVRDGTVLAVGRGRYALPGGDAATALALADGGALSYLSAAESYGWGVLHRPHLPHVTVPRDARRSGSPARVLHYADLSDEELAAARTSPVRTVLDCARTLSVPQGLAVADSALRSGAVLPEELVDAAARYRGAGARRARLVCTRADARAANPFESALRGLLLADGLTTFQPQHLVRDDGLMVVVDLADPERRVALEADGFAVHGTRQAFARDLARHDDLASAGWVTRRFAWEHVLGRPAWVVQQVRSALAQRLVAGPPLRTRRVLRAV